MGARGFVALGLALTLGGGCRKSESGAPDVAPTPEVAEPESQAGNVEAVDPLPPRASDPGFDAIAEALEIDTVTPGVLWLGPDATREILFVLATGAWSLEPADGGVALRAGTAARLAARLGLHDGDVVTALDELAVRSVADARAALSTLASGERVRVVLRRDGESRRILVRVLDGGPASARTRVEDIVAAGLHEAPEPSIERAVLVGLGGSRADLVLELLGLPPDAVDVSIAGASIARDDLARALGSAAASDRLEITAGGTTLSRRIVSGAIEASDLEEAIARLPPAAPSPSSLGEILEVEPPVEGVERVDDEHVRITRELLDSWLADPATLAKAARIVPSQKDGVTQGFKLYGIRRGSPAKALGFKNGDMLTAVNGHALTDVSSAMGAFAKARKAKHVKVGFERKGKSLVMNIEVVARL